ncbi:hypothetical protein NPIL_501761 [Nephila pilipes]|uniref:Uncharacterized protein n=1 Tax=Nephila pilipes TaxID=299642 RepID=A0A8X6QWT6_NEPPI|nr:hypothetical protein NPIL_501761 [Nephila pilipes]
MDGQLFLQAPTPLADTVRFRICDNCSSLHLTLKCRFLPCAYSAFDWWSMTVFRCGRNSPPVYALQTSP